VNGEPEGINPNSVQGESETISAFQISSWYGFGCHDAIPGKERTYEMIHTFLISYTIDYTNGVV